MLPTHPPKRQPEHALSTAFVRTVAAAGRYCDGQGLYLDVQPSGSRSWVQRIAIRGRRRELGLGGFPLVSLKEARALAFANRKLARAGGDPLAEKRRLQRTPTFAAAAEQVWTQMQPGWRNPKYGKDWMSSMTRFAFPRIGQLPVSEVTSADVIETLRPVWHVRPATARRVRERISTVMEWAVAMDLRADNPCGRRRQGVSRPGDVPAGQRKGASLVPRLAIPDRSPRLGSPCASRMIPLESPVPEIGPPGSESGGRKRAYGTRTAARRESAG